MYELWSAGLEEWEPVMLSEEEKQALTWIHSKRVAYDLYAHFKDNMGRWFRTCLGPAPKDVPLPE